jgi:putative MATE family efflux protein
MSLIQAIGFTVGMGSGNTLSQYLGKQDVKMAERVASTGFFTAFSIGAVFSAICLIFLDRIVLFLGATDTIVPVAKDYIRIILYAAPFMISTFTLNNIIRYQGNAVYSMVGIAIGGVLNIFLDPLFILTFDMGIEGAAWATAISQVVSFTVLLAACFKGNNIRIRIKDFTFRYGVHKKIFVVGMPSFFRQGMASIAAILLNYYAGIHGGDPAIAAMTVVTKVFMLAQSMLIGFGQGFQPVCGFNYGAGLYKRVREAFFFCVKVGIGILAAFSVIALIFAPELVALFRDEPEVIVIGAEAMRYQAVLFPLSAWVMMSNMLLQATEKPFAASFLSIARQGLCFIPTIVILSALFDLPGVQVSQAVADALSFCIALPMGIKAVRELTVNGDSPVEKNI